MNLIQTSLACAAAALFFTGCDSVTVVERHPDRRYGYHGDYHRHDGYYRDDYRRDGYYRRPSSTTVVVADRPAYRRSTYVAPARRTYVAPASRAYVRPAPVVRRGPATTVVVTDDRKKKKHHHDHD